MPLTSGLAGTRLHEVDDLYNQHGHLLFIEGDVNGQTSGTFTVAPVTGNITVECCDDKNLAGQLLCLLISFINTQIVAGKSDMHKASEHENAEMVAGLTQSLKPRAFYEYSSVARV